jgi:hypothetical protein
MAPTIPPALRDTYWAEQAERLYAGVRLFCALCIAINTVFIAVDYFIFPERFNIFLLVRLALNATLAFCFFAVSAKNSLSLKWVCLISTGLMLTVVVNGTGTYLNDYFVGFLLLMFGMVILFPVTGREAFSLSGALYLTYLVPALLALKAPNFDFGVQNLFLLSGVVITAAAGRRGEQIRSPSSLGHEPSTLTTSQGARRGEAAVLLEREPRFGRRSR